MWEVYCTSLIVDLPAAEAGLNNKNMSNFARFDMTLSSSKIGDIEAAAKSITKASSWLMVVCLSANSPSPDNA